MNIEITSDLGQRFTQEDCPTEVLYKISPAIKQDRFRGVVFAFGVRYDWHCHLDDTVRLEFTRGDEIEQVHEVSAAAWAKFVQLSQRREVDPKEWLSCLLAQGISDGIEIGHMIAWLFPSQREEVTAPPFIMHEEEVSA